MPKWTKLQRSFLRDADRDDRPLERLAYCLHKNEPIPDDLREFIVEAVKAGARGHLKSWDEAFGKPNTRQEYEEFYKTITLAPQIESLANKAKGSLSDAEFERIGKSLGIGGATKTKSILSWWRKLVGYHSQIPASPNPPEKSP